MKKIYTLAIFIFYIFISKAQQSNTESFPDASQISKSKITYKIIDAPNNTFGYDIYAADKLMIHQPSIPAILGNEGFRKKSDAEKVAQYVIGKIKNGEMPPSVSHAELKKIKAIKK